MPIRRGKAASPASQWAMTIVVNTMERTPYSFPGCATQKRRIRTVDYAVYDGERLVGAVARESLDDLVACLAKPAALEERLQELRRVPHPAMVIEARYSDVVEAQRAGRIPAVDVSRTLAELQARFPHVPMVFCEKRTLAATWTRRFLSAAWRIATAAKAAPAASGKAPRRPAPVSEPDEAFARLRSTLGTRGFLSSQDVAETLSVSRPRARALLFAWSNEGRLAPAKSGPRPRLFRWLDRR